MKATAIAPANIAFIKYWGKRDQKLRLPANGSISVNLNNLTTTTTVEFTKQLQNDEVQIDGQNLASEVHRVVAHLDRIRKLARFNYKAKVVSKNNFSKASGLASSASGFAALTLAATYAAGLNLSQKDLSILARQGSGSACRSIPDGFVEWLDGNSDKTSYAVSLFPPRYWNLNIIVVLVEAGEKLISTTQGQKLADTNPFFKARISHIKTRIKSLKQFMARKELTSFGKLIEAEALELHAICLTSEPPILYWQPATVAIMQLVRQLRQQGIEVYHTNDAGPHVHLICEPKNVIQIKSRLAKIKGIKQIIVNKPAKGAYLIDKHLF